MSDIKNIIEEAAKRGLEMMNVEGFSVAVVKDGEVVFSGGFGYADREANEEMTAKHILPIGSASKAFTATGAVMLANDGKLCLDTPVRDYVPAFRLSDPEASASTTLRDLLCHRTGMPRHDLLWICWDDAERDSLIFDRLPHLAASKPFRSLWQYQNYMYAASGCIIEKLSGKSWEDFTRERIFAPLGMNSSGFLYDQKNPEYRYSKLYKPDSEKKNQIVQHEKVSAIGPAGSIGSSAEDMAQWLKFNLSRGKAGEEALLKEESFAELWKPNIPYELFPFEVDEIKRLGYGLGWFGNSYRGNLCIEHGGNLSGAAALVSMLPDKNIGVVILTNTDSTLLTYALAGVIQDALLDVKDGRDWIAFYKEKYDLLKSQGAEQLKAFYATKVEGKPESHDISEYVGTYTHPGYGEINVILNDSNSDSENRLSVKFHGLDTRLTHLHYDIFYMEFHEIPLPASFKTGVDGSVESLSVQFEPSLKEFITFKRVPESTKGEDA